MGNGMDLTNDDFAAALLDTLIPPRSDRGLAGAGRPEVIAYVRERLGGDPMLAGLVAAGFEALAGEARALGGDFASLSAEQRVQALKRVETPHPFLIPLVLLQAYPSYYQQLDVLEGLGKPARPPFPEGYTIDVDDTDLLKKIRQRVGRPE